MALSEIFTVSIGRDLSVEEVELVQRLSPQGVAKVNSDVAQGANLEQTLAELKVVLQATQKRKALAEGLIPGALLPIVREMGRPLTAEEMVLFTGTSVAALHSQIIRQAMEGEGLEDIVEELAHQHRQRLLQGSARRLADEEGKVVKITPLSPTQLKTADRYGLTVSVTELSERLRLGPGPVVTWFAEEPVNPDKHLSACTLAGPCTPSPRSILKKIPCLPTVDSDASLSPAQCRASRISFGDTVVIEEVLPLAQSLPSTMSVRSSTMSSVRHPFLGLLAVSLSRPGRVAPSSLDEALGVNPKGPWKLPLLKRLFSCHQSPAQPKFHHRY
eukprot:RCo017048